MLSEYRLAKLKPLLDSKNMNYQFTSIALNTNLEEAFDDKLGPVEFMWEERKKVQIVAFAIESCVFGFQLTKKLFAQKFCESLMHTSLW